MNYVGGMPEGECVGVRKIYNNGSFSTQCRVDIEQRGETLDVTSFLTLTPAVSKGQSDPC